MRRPLGRASVGGFGRALTAGLALVGLLAAVSLAWAHDCPTPPFRATLKFQNAPANATFAPGAPIRIILQIQNTCTAAQTTCGCNGGQLLTSEGFSNSDFFRRLFFFGPQGLIINKSEETLHGNERTLFCGSRQGTALSQAIPVAPVEVLSGPPSPFFRQYLIDASQFYDLLVPGHYTVDARFEISTFTANTAAVFSDCDQFPGPPPVALVDVSAVDGRHAHSVQSNALQFVIAGAAVGGPIHHIVISPDTATIAAGGTQFYTAQGFDANDLPLGDVTSMTSFSIAGGTCPAQGPGCTATTPGDHQVTGTLSGKSDTAVLTVAPPSDFVKVWVGLEDSDDVGIRFDLKAIVTKNDQPVGSGELGSVFGGSSGFNNASLQRIPIHSASGPLTVASGDKIGVEVLVRNACARSTKGSGTARLWFDGAHRDSGTTRDAASRLDNPAGATLYYLRSAPPPEPLPLDPNAGSARTSIDKAAGGRCGPYQSFGTWTITAP